MEQNSPHQKYKIYRKTLITKLPIWPKWLPLLRQAYQISKREKIEIIQVGQVLPVGTVALFIKKRLKMEEKDCFV